MQTVLINVLWESDCRRLPVEDGSSLWALRQKSHGCGRYRAEAELKSCWEAEKCFYFGKNLEHLDSVMNGGDSCICFSHLGPIQCQVNIPWIYPKPIYWMCSSRYWPGWDLPWNRFPSIVQASTRWLWHLTGGTAVQHKVFPTGVSLNWCSRSSKNWHFIPS